MLSTKKYVFEARSRKYLIQRGSLSAVIVALHPTTGTAEGFAADTQFHTRTKASIIYPQATGIAPGTSWNAGSEPPTNRAEELGVNDAGFAHDILVREQLRALPIYIVGFSGGGRLMYHIAGDTMQLAHGVSIAGVPTDPTVSAPRSCPLLHIHGDADLVEPYDGGGIAGHQSADVGLQRFRDAGYGVTVQMIPGGGHYWDFGTCYDTTGRCLSAWGL